MKARVLRWMSYFRRAHSVYLSFFLSFAQFVTVQYVLLISNIPMFSDLSMLQFAILFSSTYASVSVVLGWWDYNHGGMIVDNILAAQSNPWTRDYSRAFLFLCDGETEKAKDLMRRWAE